MPETKKSVFQKILLCIDGEPHTNKAVDWALSFAEITGAQVTALHVKNTYLKKFYNEIYAQGRKAYIEYVDKESGKYSTELISRFRQQAEANKISYNIVEKTGIPFEEILKEFSTNAYDILVIGGKHLNGMSMLKSKNMPAKLAAKIKTKSLFIIRK